MDFGMPFLLETNTQEVRVVLETKTKVALQKTVQVLPYYKRKIGII